MARKIAPLKMGMISQDLGVLDYYHGWNDVELTAIQNNNAHDIGVVLCNRMYNAGIPVSEWHCIIHDSDTRNVWNESRQMYVVEQKLIHFHFVFRLYTDDKIKGAELAKIASAVGLDPQYVEKAPRGSDAYDNMVAYLCHIKYTDRYQYDISTIASGGVSKDGVPLWRPYADIYASRREAWLKGRAKVTAKRAKVEIDDLEEQILTGVLTRNQVLLTDNLYEVYARNKRRCDDAFATYQDRRIAKAIAAMESGQFSLSVYYITGKSHSGKSVFTDRLVYSLCDYAKSALGETWTRCDCAANNPVDDYDGSEILVMDDLRGMSMCASDWLKLLDPDRVNISSARYHNKRVACRVIIINSERDVLDFFYYIKGSGGDRAESMDQFFRRILAHVQIYRVPDDPTVRRAIVGEMQETTPYNATSGANKLPMVLHHNFRHNYCDMAYDDAIARLTALTMCRNGCDVDYDSILSSYDVNSSGDNNDNLVVDVKPSYKPYSTNVTYDPMDDPARRCYFTAEELALHDAAKLAK